MNIKPKFRSVDFNHRGFSSLAEIILVMGILVLIMSIGMISLTRVQHSSSLSSTIDIFKSDFKNQQLKAMLGETQAGTGPDNYGIHFDSNGYTLFKGNNPDSDPNKFVINLPSTIDATTFFLDDNVIFIKGSGEIAGCCTASTITFLDSSVNIEKTISVNRYGAITID